MPSFVPGRPVEVENLGVLSDAAEWMGMPSLAYQRAEVARAGMTWGESSDVITTTPGTWVTAEALGSFCEASEGLSGPVEGVVVGDMASWSNEACFGPPARLFRGGSPGLSEHPVQQVNIEVPGRTLTVPSADSPGGRKLEIPISDGLLISAHHWSGVLWANLLCLPSGLWRNLIGPNWNLVWKIPLAWLKTRSSDPMVLSGALNRVERGAFIHPSAVVEGCWVRRGARVGPGAVVRGCILGEGAVIESQALATYSVFGPGAVVQRRGWIQYGVAHASAAVGGAMQLGVLGPNTSFKHGSYLMDQNTSQSVHAIVNGVKCPAPLGVLGVGVGKETTIASGVWVAPGRTIAPGQTILPDPNRVLVKTAVNASGVFMVSQSELKPTS